MGQTITYTYVIINSGNVNLGPDQFTITDDHIGTPLGTPFNCGPAGTTLTPNTGTIAAPSAGSSVTCQATYTITQADLNAGSVTNTASASGGGISSPSVQATVNAVQNKILTLQKSAAPATYATVGTTITYSYRIINTGNVDIGPAQFTITDDHIGTPPGTPFNCGPAGTTLTPNTGTLVAPSHLQPTFLPVDRGKRRFILQVKA